LSYSPFTQNKVFMVRKVLLMFNFMALGMGHLPAQLRVEGSFSIAANGAVAVGGDLYSEADLAGDGRLVLVGASGAQRLDLRAHTVSHLEILNPSGAVLTGDVRIGRTLRFTAGQLRLGDRDLRFAPRAVTVGAGPGQCLVTDGSGAVTAEAIAPGGSFRFPIGHSTAAGDFSPAEITNLSAPRDLTLRVEPVAGSGINRSWRLSSDRTGDLRLGLTHAAGQETPGFDNEAAFITHRPAGSQTPGDSNRPAGAERQGSTHSGNFMVHAGPGAFSHFSKSSFSPSSPREEALSSNPLTVNRLELLVLPNPSRDEARIRITAAVSGEAVFELADAAGRTLATGPLPIARGTVLWMLPVGELPPGVYVLRITGEPNLQGFVKIIKS
jgi:hypothetical protein